MRKISKEPEAARTASDSIAPAFRTEPREPTQPNAAEATVSQAVAAPRASAAPVLIFEHAHRGDRWRLEAATHGGRRFANFRKWYVADEELKPTKQGFTMSLERLPELHAALAAYLGKGRAGAAPDPSAI